MRPQLVPRLRPTEQRTLLDRIVLCVRVGFLRPGWHRLTSRALGQDVVEYGLIVATIAIVILVGTVAFGNQIEPWFQHLAGRITTTGT